ncbi:MAG: aminotransferase class I/II-fold pyridoxal phosphate-dependent enzyme [Lachnospiraceae bacterium]|nr:aminotransferase class I/II-fold pyridoxal phosphate-dependent enzyme [Lachnospiraceae bacterium]
MSKVSFACDYLEGAHERILRRMTETNLTQYPGYGEDEICSSAKEKIRQAIGCPDAVIHFLVGGTQVNALAIDALLTSYQGVLAPATGHIALHEAGAIEANGHKVITLPQNRGKISAADLKSHLVDFYHDEAHEHMVQPGMVYISQPTEYGTLYSLEELTAISQVCREYQLPLYVDGARLAYALASPENDVTLPDLARLADVFYIGGTKCGALFGEALVITDPARIRHLFTMVKQHGGLLAKGRLLGIQFDELFANDLYLQVGENAIRQAARIRQALREHGWQEFFETPTNQIFVVVDNDLLPRFGQQIDYCFWEKYDETHTVIRLATSWATTDAQVDALLQVLAALH